MIRPNGNVLIILAIVVVHRRFGCAPRAWRSTPAVATAPSVEWCGWTERMMMPWLWAVLRANSGCTRLAKGWKLRYVCVVNVFHLCCFCRDEASFLSMCLPQDARKDMPTLTALGIRKMHMSMYIYIYMPMRKEAF